MAAVQTGQHIWLVIFAVLCAAISAYYYFRIIQAMFFKEAASDAVILADDITPAFKILLVITAVLIIVLGLFPHFLTNWLYF